MSPLRIRSSVVLPAPFEPVSCRMSPLRSSRLTPRSTCLSPRHKCSDSPRRMSIDNDPSTTGKSGAQVSQSQGVSAILASVFRRRQRGAFRTIHAPRDTPTATHCMPTSLTVLIVGGYGTFGGRLARLLSDVSGLTLLIGGRSPELAQQFCSGAAGVRARLVPVHFDRTGDVEGQLRRLAPNIVVDASGPFQFYGER